MPGTYELTYTVADEFENTATVTRTVEVAAQSLPEIRTPQGNTIYLTFDDGPGPFTNQLLDVLKKHGVKATFFVVDTGYDAVMKRIVDEGHSIGIHSVTHDYETIYASPEAYFADLYGMQDIIYENTGIRTSLLRFPGGGSNTVSSYNEGIMTILTRAVQDAGFRYFDWNVDSNDAGGAKKTATVVENVTEGVTHQKCSVVLQHDIHAFSVEAVEEIIIWGLRNGYTFLPLEMDSPVFQHAVYN
jgi:peptidoglycan/xylan/chitin deacetylase (PgdA/CDA1 family)